MSGRVGNNRRGYRHRDRNNDNWQESPGQEGRKGRGNFRYDRDRGNIYERFQWVPPALSAEPLPSPNCPYCGKPIRDVASAIEDRDLKKPVHFDCIIARIAKNEILEKGDIIAYIGGGRFGVVHFNGSKNTPLFKIKKIMEWEDRENRVEWRKTISDHYSIT